MEKRNATKAKLIYDAIDDSGGFYKGTVSDKAARSHMNVTFQLPSDELTDKFIKEASAKNDMVALKGYRTVGGIRASIYNAMPVEGARRWRISWEPSRRRPDSGPPSLAASKSCSSLDDVDEVPMRPVNARAARRPGVAGHTSEGRARVGVAAQRSRRSRSRPGFRRGR